MNILLSIFTFFAITHPIEPVLDITDDASAAVKTGNAANVAKYFSASVDMKILDKEDVYSKAQAELILKEFFSGNPVKSFTIIHKGTSKNGDQFAIELTKALPEKNSEPTFSLKKKEPA